MGANNKAMEEALQAAVARMNNKDGAGSGPLDPLSVLAAVLPKLLENRGEREDIAEQVESLRAEELAPLREQLRVIRARLHQLTKSQEAIMEALDQMREQQTAVGEVVLQIAQQMSQIQFVESEPEPEPAGYRAGPAPAPRRAPSPAAKAPKRVAKNGRHEQS